MGFMRVYFSTISCGWSAAGILPETYFYDVSTRVL